MKNLSLAAIAAFVSFNCFSQSRDVQGTWVGTLNIGVEIRAVFHITRASSGIYSATMDSPDQGIKDISVSSVSVTGDSLHLGVTAFKGSYDGLFANDTTVTGNWRGASKTPLILIKTNRIIALNRPQTPNPPFNYVSEDVEYSNADNSVHFGGTLTYPASGGPFPAAILITGSGQQDRDETIFEHTPFAVIANYLTLRGFEILRVDDRGVGKTTGEVIKATSADFANDVQAGFAYLKSRKEVNKNKIGLIGHSEGGIIAPIVAAQNKEIAFIILWGAPIVGGLVVNTEQNGYALKKAGFSNDAINAFELLHKKELGSFKTSENETALDSNVLSIFREWGSQQTKKVLKDLFVTDGSIVGQSIYQIYNSLYGIPWMRFFIEHDFAQDLAKVKCPVLAINGEKDTQVDASSNLALVDSILRTNHNYGFETATLRGLNHLLQTANTGDASEYRTIEETIAPEALVLIGNWLHETVGRK
jgi:uncharacterized protein